MTSVFARKVVNHPCDRDVWVEAFRESRSQTAMGPHNVELVDIADDYAVLEMPIDDAARQPFGLLHGGVSLMLAETAASMHACWGIDLTTTAPVGIEVSGSHLSAATEGRVRVTATVVKRGRTLIRHRVEVVHVETGRVLSEVRVTNLYTSR